SHLPLPSFPTRRSSDLDPLRPGLNCIRHLGLGEEVQSLADTIFVTKQRAVIWKHDAAVPMVDSRARITRLITSFHASTAFFQGRSEEHTSELQSRENLV